MVIESSGVLQCYLWYRKHTIWDALPPPPLPPSTRTRKLILAEVQHLQGRNACYFRRNYPRGAGDHFAYYSSRSNHVCSPGEMTSKWTWWILRFIAWWIERISFTLHQFWPGTIMSRHQSSAHLFDHARYELRQASQGTITVVLAHVS